MLRRLHHADRSVVHEGDSAREEVGPRHEVRVENGHEIRSFRQGADVLECMVDVACLGVVVVGPREIMAAEFAREAPQPGAPSVVEHPDAIIAVLHTGRADDRALEDGSFLVVSADQDVDQRRVWIDGSAVYPGRTCAVDGPAQKQQGQCDRNERGRLQQHEGITDHGVRRQMRWWECRGDTPIEIAEQEDQRHDGQERARHRAVAPEQRHDRHEGSERDQAWRQRRHHGAVSRRANTTRPVRPTVQAWAAASPGATVTR
ncbi:hypothetical protein ABIF42_002882 [Bradyrhizobium diazoefficiens]